MNALISLGSVLAIMLVAYVGVGILGLRDIFGIILPYAAIAIFLTGFVYRIMKWAKTPVPFRIPTTCGQQKSLPWIKWSRFENPNDMIGVIGRMALEILCFRSLFRNTKTELHEGPKVVYSASIWLWAGALAFHYCFLTIVIRHLRFFMEPTPFFVSGLEYLDSFFEIGIPPLMLSGLIFLAALCFLLGRRLQSPQLRYISLPADYFALFLLMGIAITGILIRHFVRIDVYGVKELAMGLATFHPTAPEGVHWFFYLHLTLVSTLLVFFPFSKLMHMGGVFFSPTRNMANNNRTQRHINPWNYPVKVHTYEEYEDDFREKMKNVGLPVDKE
jgi:[DsrC]-trisulfide reductase subunit M